MSEKEKQFVELVSKLPESAQDRFLEQAKGAVTALDAVGIIGAKETKKEEKE